MKNTELQKYRKLVSLRNLLKDIKQLSWNITQLELRYPFEKLKEENYNEMLKAYMDFNYEIQGIAHNFREETVDNEIINDVIDKK